MRLPTSITVLAIVAFTASPAFANSSVQYGGKKVSIASSFQTAMQCILDKLKQEKNYNPKEVGCFGTRPNRSAHPTGHACDIDQTSRNVTKLNGPVPKEQQIQLAQGCEGAVSGCKWGNPDCGHFEQRSAPYSPTGTPAGGHRYPESQGRHVSRQR